MQAAVERFSLRDTLRADLVRYRHLTGSTAKGFGLRAWLAFLSPRLLPNLLIRVAFACDVRGLRIVAKMLLLFAFVVFGIEVTARCPIGPGLFLPHTQGTVIGAAEIGKNCTIYHGVTIGALEIDIGYTLERRPVIGDDVVIGSGAKVLGPIGIGDGAKIGSNANIVRSLPAGSLALAPECVVRTA